MVNMLHRKKKRVNDGFSVSKLKISMLQTRNMEKKYEDVELQVLLDENDSQTQKQLAEQLLNKLFLIAYERWERFRKSADGCHMN